MGNKKITQSIILVIIFAVTGFLVYRSAEPVFVTKTAQLQKILGPVEGYSLLRTSPLDEEIYAFLELDDYTQSSYQKNGQTIGLYIGYYFTIDKVSAAHSPLVCFPGQGWEVDLPLERTIQVGPHTINYAEIIASLEGREELIMYWYQAGTDTATAVYKNKFYAVINKMTGKSQEHAFVRVSVPIADGNREKARQTGEEFIAGFYPVFLDYVNNSNEQPAD